MNNIKTDIGILKDHLGIFEHVAENLGYDHSMHIYKNVSIDDFDSTVDHLVEYYDAEKEGITYSRDGRRLFSFWTDNILFILMEVNE